LRLFTGLWPAREAVRDVSRALGRLSTERSEQLGSATANLRGFRFVPADRWHLTLRFHGDDADPEELGAQLAERVRTAELAAPRLRLAGAGTFANVLWLAVEPAGEQDERSLRALVRAAGGEPDEHRAHVTVARWRRGRARGELAALLADHAGPWFTADEVVLVRSDHRPGGAEYATVRRVPLGGRG
jgi:2'-5' RNA ligase